VMSTPGYLRVGAQHHFHPSARQFDPAARVCYSSDVNQSIFLGCWRCAIPDIRCFDFQTIPKQSGLPHNLLFTTIMLQFTHELHISV
jgi:hypothetical protein